MSSSLRRGTLAATALALSTFVLTACGAGNDAQTLEVKPDNPAATQGPIKIQNVHVVTAADDSDQAVVNARIFNSGEKAQTLDGISLPGSSSSVRLQPAKGGKLVVPAGEALAIGGKGKASALIEDAAAAGLSNGANQALAFKLSSTGTVKVEASVVPAKHQYATSGPSTSPSQQPSGSSTQSPGQGQDESGRSGEEASEQGNATPDETPGQAEETQQSQGSQTGE